MLSVFNCKQYHLNIPLVLNQRLPKFPIRFYIFLKILFNFCLGGFGSGD